MDHELRFGEFIGVLVFVISISFAIALVLGSFRQEVWVCRPENDHTVCTKETRLK